MSRYSYLNGQRPGPLESFFIIRADYFMNEFEYPYGFSAATKDIH